MLDAETRRLVRQRAEHRCEYCHLPEVLGDVTFHVEHIVARQHQGGDEVGQQMRVSKVRLVGALLHLRADPCMSQLNRPLLCLQFLH